MPRNRDKNVNRSMFLLKKYEDESGVTDEGHEESRTERNFEGRLGCGRANGNNTRENIMQEVVDLGEVNSSNLKITNPTEPKYRLGNRRKVGSYLSISKKDYQKLKKGRSFNYVNANSGSLVTIRIVAKDQKQFHEHEGGELERGVPPIYADSKAQEDVNGMDGLMVEDSLENCRKEVADSIERVDVKERNQVNGPTWKIQKFDQVPSRCSSKYGMAPVNAAERRRRRISRFRYGARTRVTQKRSANKNTSNLFACRFRTGSKRKRVTH